MSNRGTERQRDGDTEKMSLGDMDGTQETEDVPPLAARVETLQEAVQLSLKDRVNDKCLFALSRAIKAFEITNNRRLPPKELPAAFALWWSAAKPHLPPDADFDEWCLDFEDTFAKTHSALGANSLEEAIRRAATSPLPTQAARYSSPKLKRLIAVCYHLQILQGASPFFLSVRDTAQIMETKNLHKANAMRAGLVRHEILIEVEKGTRKRATRFRFNLPESAPTGESKATAPAKPGSCNTPAPPASPAVACKSKLAKPPVRRTPTPYELAQKKKALQDLINGICPETDFGYQTPEEAKRLRELNNELRRVNSLLAGVGE